MVAQKVTISKTATIHALIFNIVFDNTQRAWALSINERYKLRFQLKGVEAGSRELGGQDEWSTGKRGGPNDGVGCR